MQLAEVVTSAWSTVCRSTTPTDRYWFNDSSSANPAEGSVHHVLSQLAPGLVDPPVAWDDSRGWLLTEHSGSTVAGTGTTDLETLAVTTADYLSDYAQLQVATIDQPALLLSRGLPDGRPGGAAELAGRLLARMAAYPATDPRHLTDAEVNRLSVALPTLVDASSALEAGPVPSCFDHNDVCPRNVFVPTNAGRYRFFDFADSLWAHPFGSLVMTLWELVHRYALDVGDAGPIDLRDTPIRPIYDRYSAAGPASPTSRTSGRWPDTLFR